MNAAQVFELLALRYADKPDDFLISIGHQALPCPDQPIGIFNMPEIQAYMSLKMSDVRAFSKGQEILC